MKIFHITAFIWFVVVSHSCNHDNPLDYGVPISVEGEWGGSLNGDQLDLSFTEGSILGIQVLTGSASVRHDSVSILYMIIDGRHTGANELSFHLRELLTGNQDRYLLIGSVRADTIKGTFGRLDNSGHIVETGSWRVVRDVTRLASPFRISSLLLTLRSGLGLNFRKWSVNPTVCDWM